MKSKSFTVKTIAALGVLTSLVVVLQVLSNFIQFGPVSITLALTPIVVGALLFGPIAGLFLGVVDGAIILTAPSTQGFFVINIWATVLVCLLKTGIAGFVAGLIFLLFKRKENLILLGPILAAISVPIINTGLFIEGFFVFFNVENKSLKTVLASVISWNFLIEFLVNSAFASTVYRIYLAFKGRSNNEL